MKKDNKKTYPHDIKASQSDEIAAVDNFEVIKKGGLAKLKDTGARVVIGTLNVFANPVNYKNSTPRLPIGRNRKFFDLAVLLIVMALGGIVFFFWFVFSPKIAPVEIEITCTPDDVYSGDEIACQIKYKNDDDESLHDVSLALDLPEHFKINTDKLENFDIQNNTFSLGDLKPGASGKLNISGVVWGDIEEQQVMRLVFSCKNENNAIRHKIGVKRLDFVGSLLDIELEMPDKVYSYDSFSIKLKYTNNSTKNIEDGNLVIRYPITYERESVETDLTEIKSDEYAITDLAPGESAEIEIKGYLNEKYQEDSIWVDFTSDIYIELDGKKLLQKKQEKWTEVAFANFEFNSNRSHENMTLGENLEYTLEYQNKEEYNIENLKVWLEYYSPFLNPKSFKFDSANLENIDSRDVIVWSDLGGLEVGQGGEVSLSLATFNQISVSNYETAKNFKIRLIPKASYNLSTTPNQKIIAVGAPVDILLNSDLSLIAQARYFTDQGDQLGIGPLPPATTEETRYWIAMKITNTSNEVNNLNLIAQLPASVRWTEKTNVSHGGALNYNIDAHRVSWQIDKLDEYLGRIIPAYTIGFEVGITPNDSDIGKILPLVNSISISGTDAFTGDTLIDNVGALTTELIHDQFVESWMYEVEEW